MKIQNDVALIGAPGSGKTALAKKLKRNLLDEHVIIDGYADRVSKQADIMLGPYATWIGNLMVASDRQKKEIAHFRREQPYILCGTLMETIAYLSLRASTAQSDAEFRKSYEFGRFLGVWVHDFFAYAHIFYLPLSDNDPVKVLDREIEQTLSIYGVKYDTLRGDDKFEVAKAAVLRTEQEAAAEAPTADTK